MFLTLYHFSVLDGTFATWDTRFFEGLCEETLIVEGEPDGLGQLGHGTFISVYGDLSMVGGGSGGLGHGTLYL